MFDKNLILVFALLRSSSTTIFCTEVVPNWVELCCSYKYASRRSTFSYNCFKVKYWYIRYTTASTTKVLQVYWYHTRYPYWSQCYKIQYLCITDIFSVFPFFVFYFNVVKLRHSILRTFSPYFGLFSLYFGILFYGLVLGFFLRILQ